VRRVEVDGFWMDDHPVTVAEFRRFVRATGYVTVAERPLDPGQYPGADPALLTPGSLVFQLASGPVDLRDIAQWWRYTPGADWRHPKGPGSTTNGLDRHPVTHVAAEGADARRTTACATDRPPARGRPSTPPPRTWDSAASSRPAAGSPYP
jgi:formylglycine-generating enzyme required for sulfatase activity